MAVRRSRLGFLALILSTLALQPAWADLPGLVEVRELTPQLERARTLIEDRFDLVLQRHAAMAERSGRDCAGGDRAACRLDAWKDFLGGLAGDEEQEQIYRVHRYINHARYVTDDRNWQRTDFWAVPEQLFERGGDCEDFVIAKYLSLRSLGVPAERMRLVVVYDRNRGEDHAVLTISTPDDVLVLDNFYRRVLSWSDKRDQYVPYYSLNENAVWIHNVKT